MATDLKERGGIPDAGDDALNPAHDPYDNDSVFGELTSAEHLAKNGGQDRPNNRKNEASTAGRQTEGGPQPDYSGKQLSPGDLSTAEQNSDGTLGAGYSEESQGESGRASLKSTFWGSKKRRRSTVTTALVMLMAGGGGGSLLLASGPGEFIRVAQELTSHGSIAADDGAGDSRMGQAYRFLRSGGDPGETRVGLLGSTMKGNMLADLEEIGLKPVYGSFKYPTAIEIDTQNDSSPYKGLDEDELRTKLSSQGVTKDIDIQTGEDGSIVKATIGVKGFFGSRNAATFLVKNLGESKIPDALRVRWLSKYFGFSWHPLEYLESQAQVKLWDKARAARLKGQEDGTELNEANAEDQETDAQGKVTTTPAPGLNETPSSTKVSDTLESFHAGGAASVVGGLAAAQGLMCGLKAVDDNIGAIKYAHDIVPLMNMGVDAITVGQQVETGKDVDTKELGILSQQFYNSQDKSSWASAKTVEADDGDNTSSATDMNSGVQDTLKEGAPSWLNDVTSVPGLGAVCSKVGSVIGSGAGFVLSIFSGGTVSALVGGVASYLVAPHIIGDLSHLLAGDAVNIASSGAEWGNDIKYGAQYFGNTIGVSQGGTKLSAGEVSELESNNDAISQQEFSTESVAYRLFSPDDSRSLLSKITQNESPEASQDVASLASSFMSLGGTLLKMPGDLLSGISHADPQPYQYPFAEYGFSEEDLDNPAVADPFANADTVAQLLDASQQPGYSGTNYIAQAQQCFDVSIQKIANDDSTPRWDVIPGASDSNTALNVYDTIHYNSDTCADASDPNWLKIRMFILDTGVMEGYACQHGDQTSCTNDGFAGSGDTSSGNTPPASGGTTGGSGGAVSGDPQSIAKQILANTNINLSYNASVKQDVEDAAKGEPGTAGAMTKTAILQLIATVGQTHKVSISAIQSDGQGHCNDQPKSVCPDDPHYNGDAVDFDALDGVAITGRNAPAQTIMKIAEGVLSAPAAFGQSQCGDTPPLPTGWSDFQDTCNHLHVQDVAPGQP